MKEIIIEVTCFNLKYTLECGQCFRWNKIDEEYALESLKVYAEIIDKMEENDRLAAIKEAQNCANR